MQEPTPAPKGGLLYDILHLGDHIKAKLQPLAEGLDGALPNIRADPVGDFLESAASAADWEPQRWGPPQGAVRQRAVARQCQVQVRSDCADEWSTGALAEALDAFGAC